MTDVGPERVQNNVDSKAWILYRALKISYLFSMAPSLLILEHFEREFSFLLIPDIES